MGRPSYVCTIYSEHFTRKYSAKRHNQNLHTGMAEIVRLYTPNNPFWFKPNNQYGNIGPATIADSMGNTFEPTYLPQQTPTQHSANSIYTPGQVMDDQSYPTGLSQDTIVKIDELRRLMNKYPKYHMNRDGIIQWAIHCSFDGDNIFLDDKLEQLRTIDSLANIK